MAMILSRVLLMLIVFWSVSVLGQNKFTEVQLPSRSTENYWIVPDDEGNLCIQYFKKPYLYFKLIDSRGELVEEIKEPFKYRPEVFAGGYSNGKFNFYYRPRSKKKEGDLGAFSIHSSSREYTQQRHDIRASKSEDFIGHFIGDNGVYLMISVRGGNLIRIAKLDGGMKPEVKNFTAPALIEKAFSAQYPLLFVNPLAPKSVYSFQSTRKVFFENDRFYFTFDHPEQFKTFIWEVDWEENTSGLRSIPEKKLVFGTSSNSYIHQGNLYRFTVDQVKIDLSIYDLISGDSLTTYTHTGETKIPFQSGPINFIDEFGTQNRIQTMRNDKLFKQLSNGNAAVFVERINNSNAKVTLGAFNEVSTGLSIGGGFGSFGRAGGVSIGGSRQLTGTRRGSTFIHTYLTSPHLELSGDNEDLLTPNERIFRYLDKNRRNITVSKVYSYDEDRIHLAYIDYNEAKLQIIEFSR